MKKILTFFLAILVSNLAIADDMEVVKTGYPQFYVGISGGSSKSDTYSNDAKSAIPLGILAGFDDKSTDSGAKIYFGYLDDSNIFEARISYVDLGENTYKAHLAGPGGTGVLQGGMKLSGIYTEGVLRAPFIDNKAAAFIKAGFGFAFAKETEQFTGTGGYSVVNNSDIGGSFSLGVGLMVNINKNFAIQGELDKYFINAEDPNNGGNSGFGRLKASLASAGIIYRFD